MRTNQLQSLTESELSLLLHVVNVNDPIPGFVNKIDKNDLLWIKHGALISKLKNQEANISDEGKEVFNSLMIKLTKTPYQERDDYENTSKQMFTQSEFQF